jgi:AcrR family transcriptional regulator
LGVLWAEELNGYRDQQRRSIVDAAERVFLRKGLAQVNMTEIAAEARVSRPTLYKYFGTIEQLALEVQMRALDALFTATREGASACHGSALDRIRAIFSASLSFYQANPQLVRFTCLFDFYFRESYDSPASAEQYAAFLKRFAELEKTIATGQAEETIRPDLDAHSTALMVENTMLAMMQRMALRGEIISREQDIRPLAQLEQMFAMIISYLEARPSPGA